MTDSDQPAFVEIMIGSNATDRAQLIAAASEIVANLLQSPVLSIITDTPDFTASGAPYLNRVISGYTSTGVENLRRCFREIEAQLGRDRSTPNIVAIDIDLVTYQPADGILAIISPKEYSTPLFKQLSQSISR